MQYLAEENPLHTGAEPAEDRERGTGSQAVGWDHSSGSPAKSGERLQADWGEKAKEKLTSTEMSSFFLGQSIFYVLYLSVESLI